MITTIIYTIVCLVVLGLLFSVVLYLVAQKFKVEEDPRVDIVESLLPGANCGGCGLAGCRAFAEDVVKASSIGSFYCPVGGDAVMEKIATALGQEAVKTEPRVAVIKCHGTFDNRAKTNCFDGYASCKVISSLYAGDTDCKYGCLGKGDCVSVCKFDAIHLDEKRGIVEVDEEKCVACGACVKVCPKSIIELRPKGPKNRRVYVSCSNKDKGAIARKACSVSCIGCGKCAKVCAFEAITIENNLAYIDASKCKLCRKCIDECPTNAIWAVNFPLKVAVTPNKVEVQNPVVKNEN
jgi:Na+-translocating ferredoxin:NAD+ oxidoreductase RNF subunit RnfB